MHTLTTNLLVPGFDGVVLGSGKEEIAVMRVRSQARDDVIMLPVNSLQYAPLQCYSST
jgi:hypothetical protein